MGIHAKIPPREPSVSTTSQSPQTPPNHEATGRIETLLLLEAEARKCTSLKQLQYLIANETSKLIGARQTLVLVGLKTLKIVTISSLAVLDKTSPTLRWLEKSLSADRLGAKLQDENTLAKTALLDGNSAPGSIWPFCHILQIELTLRKHNGQAQLVLLKEKAFSKSDLVMADRLGDTYAHAWRALDKTKMPLLGIFTKKLMIATSLLVLAVMFIPVTLSALAPVEIIARDPIIIAAPLNGVVGKVNVNPNQFVKSGDLLFSYTLTDLTNEFELASQAVGIAQSRYRRASQDAFGSGVGRREMAELKSERELAKAKMFYAQTRLKQSHVRAIRDGVVLFADKDEWIGKPVQTGEKIMKIATPLHTDYLIKLPLSDAIILEDGDRARIFLDSDPLNPIKAEIIRRSYYAKSDDANNMAYQLIAHSSAEEKNISPANQRIGLRGTAQVYGKKVPLALFLFRKPLSALRQYFGW